MSPLPVGVLASGEGTNLQALLDTVHGREAEIVAVASDQAGARALARARGVRGPDGGVRARRATPTARRATPRSPTGWHERGVRLVVLAGYMALLTPGFLARFPRARAQRPPVAAAGVPRHRVGRAGGGLRREGLRGDRAPRRRGRRHGPDRPPGRGRAARRRPTPTRSACSCGPSSTGCCPRRSACSRAARCAPTRPTPAARSSTTRRLTRIVRVAVDRRRRVVQRHNAVRRRAGRRLLVLVVLVGLGVVEGEGIVVVVPSASSGPPSSASSRRARSPSFASSMLSPSAATRSSSSSACDSRASSASSPRRSSVSVSGGILVLLVVGLAQVLARPASHAGRRLTPSRPAGRWSMLASHHPRRRHRPRRDRHGARCGPGPQGAAVGQRQDRHRGLRPRPGRARRGARVHRRHGQGATRPRASRSARSRTLTGFPEIMDGRVKTLHPKLHAGLLAVRVRPRARRRGCAEHGVEPIDLVCVNLYPSSAPPRAAASAKPRSSRTSTSAARR